MAERRNLAGRRVDGWAMPTVASLVPVVVRTLLLALADALSPPSCAACDARLAGRSVFCAACAHSVERVENAGDRPVAFGAFGGALATALKRFKYGQRPDLGGPLGHLARLAARARGLAGDLIVPVPLHPRRLAERGYNQASLLAAEVAVELAAPLVVSALVRVRNTSQQALLDREARLDNMAHAFEAPKPPMLKGRHVIVVDDVVTTGATLAACRSALLDAGAASVTAVVVARAQGG